MKPIAYIDSGHGFFPNYRDPGAVYQPTMVYEADIVANIAKQVGLIIEPYCQVVFTRDESSQYVKDINTDLWNRVRIANDHNSKNSNVESVFVSIHTNAAASPNAHGTETYCFNVSSQGNRLAKLIQDKILKAVPRYNRGIKTANFYVLRKTDMSACLTELAFLSNPEEAQLLADPGTQRKYAEAIAEAILEYFNIEVKKQQPTVANNDGRYLGTFDLTFYCPCQKCTGKTPSSPGYKVTASGAIAQEGRTVAVDPNIIPLGSKLRIVFDDNSYDMVAEDIGGAIKQQRADIYCESHERALQLGRKQGRIYLIDDASKQVNAIASKSKITITKGEIAQMFRDVTSDRWSYGELVRANKRGLINGDENGNINPTGYTTREETAVMLNRALDYVFDKLKGKGIEITENL